MPTIFTRRNWFRPRRRPAPWWGPEDPTHTPGVASFVSSGLGGISVESTDASGGSLPWTYQWERNEDGGAWGDLSGATSLTLTDATATTPGVLYGYRLKFTDQTPDTVTSNEVFAEVYEGGAIGGGTSHPFRSALIQGSG